MDPGKEKGDDLRLFGAVGPGGVTVLSRFPSLSYYLAITYKYKSDPARGLR
jgi:hypothetical protein